MTALLVVLAYLATAAYAGGRLYHQTGLDQPLKLDYRGEPSTFQYRGRPWTFTIFGGLFWPFAIFAVLGYRRAQLATVRPVVEQEVARALDAEKSQRDARVARLERQLGLDGSP